MFNLQQTSSCCGVGELEGCAQFKAKEALDWFCNETDGDSFTDYHGFYFADQAVGSGGRRLADFIRSRRFGRLSSQTYKGKHNYNITAWLWTPNKKFWAYVTRCDEAREKREEAEAQAEEKRILGNHIRFGARW